jgi:hypothetical protein
MTITWDDLTVNFDSYKEEDLVEAWLWMIGEDKRLILISSVGDMFLQNENRGVFWLDVGRGELIQVADSVEEFEALLEDEETIREWFLVELVVALKREGMQLVPGKLYGYKKLPVMGGEYAPENFELTDIEVHFQLAGQIHEQIKDLPDGTTIEIKVKD